MIIIVHDENKTITRIIECDSNKIQDMVEKLNLEHYHTYQETNAYLGLSLDFIDDKGLVKSDKQLLEENLIVLSEDEILEDNKIRKLTIQEKVAQGLVILKDNEEIRGDVIFTLSDDEMKEKYPDRYLTEITEEVQEKTVQQAINEKEREITSLKDQYLDADLEDNEDLKSSLKVQIQEARKELSILQENLEKEQPLDPQLLR